MVDMKKFFDIFNDVYFNGALTGYCTLGTCKTRKGEFHPQKVYSYVLQRGGNRNTRYKRAESIAYIMFKEEQCRPDDVYYRMKERLHALLREMLVVLFSLFHCSCTHGCELQSKARDRWGGYDLHWQAAAYAVEKASKRQDLLNLEMRLSWDWCAEASMSGTKNIPQWPELSEGELESGFTVDKFLADIERSLNFNMRDSRSIQFLKANVCTSRPRLD